MAPSLNPRRKFCSRRCKNSNWFKNHAEYNRANVRKWRLANPDKETANRDRWKLANPERYNDHRRRWAKNNPESRLAAFHRRRAREIGGGGSYTAAEWLDKLALFASLCAYCGVDEKMTVDHMTPLLRGGSNDISNIVPACGSCNSRKHTKTAEEFMAA